MRARDYPAKWSSDDVLKALEQLPPRDAEQVYLRLQKMRAERRGSGLTADEAGLLTRVNRGFSPTWWDRYDCLVEKRRLETLSDSERGELLRLTDQIEKRQAKRLQALVQLAEIRKCTLRALMKDLGLRARTHA